MGFLGSCFLLCISALGRVFIKADSPKWITLPSSEIQLSRKVFMNVDIALLMILPSSDSGSLFSFSPLPFFAFPVERLYCGLQVDLLALENTHPAFRSEGTK